MLFQYVPYDTETLTGKGGVAVFANMLIPYYTEKLTGKGGVAVFANMLILIIRRH